MRRAAALVMACALVWSLAAPAWAVVYGSDDRVDAAQETDPALRSLATGSTAALVAPWNLRFAADGTVGVDAAPLSAWDSYCPGTPFVAQPTAATCGGILIDDDLLLTAAHCLSRVPSCRSYAYLFGYAESQPDTVDPLTRAQVYGCRAVPVSFESPPDADTHLDYAVVQLDRPVDAERSPVGFAAAPALSEGEAVTTIGFPSGLPAKIDPSNVLDPRSATLDYFSMASDTFEGSSGSGVYDAGDNLIGVFARGTADFVSEGGCRAVRVVTTPDPSSAESATYIAPVIAALCGAGWPSARLCGTTPTCGDEICSPPSETTASCSADCPAPSCGDGLCEISEWDSCPADCGDGRAATLPDGWYCQPEWYADGNTCDCDCGAPDPDCGPPSATPACASYGPGGRTPSPGSGGCSVGPSADHDPVAIAGGSLFGALVVFRRRRKTRRPRR